MKKPNYAKTILACYLGNITQAAVVNLTPLLFIPLREQFGLSFEQLGLLIMINFVTQVAMDILCAGLVDRYGYRIFGLSAQVVVILGMLCFACSPVLFPAAPYIGFVIGTILFSAGGGLFELLLSPIINGIPTNGNKSAALSLMHGFYAWGQVGTVILTTIALALFGRTSWPYIMLAWTILPVCNLFLFATAPLGSPVPETGEKQPLRKLLRIPFYLLCLATIALGGASELCMSQWSSAYFERAIGMPKLLGDMLGMTLFSIIFGLARTLHGVYGSRFDLKKLMLLGMGLATVCYLSVALSPSSGLAIAASALCGLAVSLTWPGTLAVAAETFPMAGASMFAILAASGDIGASFGPWFTSVVTDRTAASAWMTQAFAITGLSAEQLGLRMGILASAIFPLLGFLCVLGMRRLAPKLQQGIR